MLMSQINMMSPGLLVLFLALTTIHAQNLCPRRSICINIRNCPAVISILRDRSLTAEEAQILRKAQCGYEGNNLKICCNQVTTTTTTTRTIVDPENEINPPDVTNHPNLRLLNHRECGPVPGQKVIGGNKTEIFQYPWMTLIAYDTGMPNSEFRCGGTIIASRYVLTAAHCVKPLPADTRVIGVRIGDHDISKERDCTKNNKGIEVVCAERYQDFGIENIHYHPEYNIRTMRNDIALIRLNGTMDFRPRNVKPICLPFGTAATLNHKRAIVTGWGVIDWSDDEQSQELLQARVPLVSNEQCTKIYKDDVTKIWYKQLCAGGQSNVDACAGDSGGPLQAPGIYNGGSVRIIQHGVVSFGRGCGIEGIPGVYTRVSFYIKWILDTMTD